MAAASPNYKLTYFIGRGRGETPRLILAYAGVEYEDIRFEEDEWPGEWQKPTPFGQVPTLEVDGTLLCQTTAICRFLARRYGLAGQTELDQAKVDMIADCLEDFYRPCMAICSEKDVKRKPVLRKIYDKVTMPKMLERLEKLLIQNNGGDGYFVGDDLTWADLNFINVITWPNVFNVTISWEKYPKLKALKDRVESHPKIAPWIERRPVSYY